jgi:transposase, IS5 family
MGARRMYKAEKEQQLTFDGFNQSCGMKLNPKDEWVILADLIDWAAVEAEYSALFPSRRGRPAVSARQALGALVIQKRMQLSDRDLVKEIARNVSYQYFIGLQTYQTRCPFQHGVVPEFRKRLGKDFLVKANEIFLKSAKPTHAHADDKPETPAANGNMGTMILDATCSPSNVRFPQDFSLLNEAREKLDAMIDKLHDPHSGKRRPRTYRKVLRKTYLAMAKSKKRTAKGTRSVVRVMLCAVKRNMDFVDGFLGNGGFLEDRDMELLGTIRKLYAQQKEMFDEKKHRVADRIVSVTQPFVRPIVRGKAKAPVEFGAKYDVSVDEHGHARLEHIAFDPYNECTVLKDVVERYRERTGRYPKRVLVDQVYRTKENRAYCEERGVEMSGRKPGRPTTDEKERRRTERQERRNDVDRIEVERFFSVDKRRCGAGLIMTKLSKTTLGSIALAVLVANLFGVQLPLLFLFYFMDAPDGTSACHMLEIEDDAA